MGIGLRFAQVTSSGSDTREDAEDALYAEGAKECGGILDQKHVPGGNLKHGSPLKRVLHI